MTYDVYLFVATGCGACSDYWPRFSEVAIPYRRAGMRIYVGDIATNTKAARLAQELNIEATPTTVFVSRDGEQKRYIGSITAKQLERAFDAAYKAW